MKKMAEQLPDDQLASLTQPTLIKKSLVSIFKLFFFLLRLIIGAFFIYLFFGIGGAKGVFVNFFSITINASIIGSVIPELLNFALILLKTTGPIITNLTLLFPSLPSESWTYAILSQIDFFYLWFLVVIALGIASYAKLSKLKSFSTAILFFLFRSTIFVLLSILAIKLATSLQG